MKYLVNKLQQPIFLNDVRKIIPYDPSGKQVFAMEDTIFEKSNELQAHLVNHTIVQVEREQVQPKVPTNEIKTKEMFFEPEGEKRSPYVLPKRQPIMVDEDDASRVFGASDSEQHIAHMNKNMIPGRENSFIVDDYENPISRQKASDNKTAYLVEEGSRAEPEVDQRFFRKQTLNPIAVDDFNPFVLNSNVNQRPLFKTATPNLYNVHTHSTEQKNDPNWGVHSDLLKTRAQNEPQQHGEPHRHMFSTSELDEDDQRLISRSNDVEMNPLAGEDEEVASVKKTSGTTSKGAKRTKASGEKKRPSQKT